ncbi:MAG: thiamine diphosphokinase [Fimbriimonadaceae bacterium]
MGTRVLAVLAGGTPSFQPIGELRHGCDLVFAADSGQDVCLRYGFRPDVVVGDLDSVSERLAGVDYRERRDQDFSDCDKLLGEISLMGDVDLVMAGLEGDRFDHVLSSLGSIVRSGLNPRILLQQGIGEIVRAGRSLSLERWANREFSVIGLGEATVSTLGAKWEMSRTHVSYESGFSLSNVGALDNVEVTVHIGVALVILDGGVVSWE